VRVRWGILGTAGIARAQFLPGLREAGGGSAELVASRDLARAEAFAREHGVEAGVAGYQAVTDSPEIDAVYVALPNTLHAEWTERALLAGKTVLCEKPLCVGSAQTARVLDTAKSGLLWEAFAFCFQAQHRRLLNLLADGAIGEVRELNSSFHFLVTRQDNIRLSASLGGGALADVGVYPIRLAQEVLAPGDPRPDDITGFMTSDGQVDTEAIAVLRQGPQRLVLSCGFGRSHDTFTLLLGTGGQLHLTNPYHPGPADTLTLLARGREIIEHPTSDQHSFTAMLRHIHAVLAGEAAPEHLAAGSSLRTALTLEAVIAACSR
jgi:predicted dehydrogenase